MDEKRQTSNEYDLATMLEYLKASLSLNIQLTHAPHTCINKHLLMIFPIYTRIPHNQLSVNAPVLRTSTPVCVTITALLWTNVYFVLG